MSQPMPQASLYTAGSSWYSGSSDSCKETKWKIKKLEVLSLHLVRVCPLQPFFSIEASSYYIRRQVPRYTQMGKRQKSIATVNSLLVRSCLQPYVTLPSLNMTEQKDLGGNEPNIWDLNFALRLLFFKFINVHWCFVCICVCVKVKIPWNCTYRQLWATMWVLRIELLSHLSRPIFVLFWDKNLTI